MKRLITIILIFSLICSAYIMSGAGSTYLGDKEYELLEVLGLMDSNTSLSENITRGEFVKLAAKIVYTDDVSGLTPKVKFPDIDENSEYYGYLAVLANLGAVSGMPDGTFRPDENIVPDHAVKILVRITGFEHLNNGNVMLTAAAKGLFKNVSFENADTLTMAEALVMLYNALECDISGSNAMDGIVSSSKGKEIYLEKRLLIFKVRGIVSDNGITSLTGLTKLTKGKLQIGNDVFVNETGKNDILGYNVDGYYKYDERSGENRLFSVNKSQAFNTALSIYASNIRDLRGNTYIYRNDEFSTRDLNVKIPGGITLIYNKMAVTGGAAVTNDMLWPDVGVVTLLDNNGDNTYDILFVDSYRTMVVNAVDKEKEIIYGKNNQPAVNIDTTITTVSVTDMNGALQPWQNLKGYDVISVAESLCGRHIDILLSTYKVEAAIEEITEDDDVIVYSNGAKYIMSKYFVNNSEELKLGKHYNLYLDAFSKVAWAEAISSNDWLTGYLAKTTVNTQEIDTKYKFKIFEETGKFSAYELKENVNLIDSGSNEGRFKNSEIFSEITDLSGNIYEGIIKYKVNLDDFITDIELPLAFGGLTESDDRLFTLLETDDIAGSPYHKNNFGYKTSAQTFGGRVMAGDLTKIFVLPSDREYEKGYRISTTSMLANDQGYVFKAYGTSSQSVLAKYLVIQSDSGAALDANNYPIAVSKISECVDEDGINLVKISGYQRNAPVEFFAEASENILSKIGDPMKTAGMTYTLEPGDIIRVSQNGTYIDYIELIYKSKTGALLGSTGYYEDGVTNGNPYALSNSILENGANRYSSGSPRIMQGYVYSYYDGFITMTTQDITTSAYDPTGENGKYIITSYRPNATMFMTVDMKGGNPEVRGATNADVKSFRDYGADCSKILVMSAAGEMRGIFIINN